MTDPRDPRGLRGDAPLLDGWLRFTGQAAAGELTPMSVPGHKQRRDLTGAVTEGDAPLYGGLDTIKHADELLADAERRAADLWGAVVGDFTEVARYVVHQSCVALLAVVAAEMPVEERHVLALPVSLDHGSGSRTQATSDSDAVEFASTRASAASKASGWASAVP